MANQKSAVVGAMIAMAGTTTIAVVDSEDEAVAVAVSRITTRSAILYALHYILRTNSND
jgi:hypothetical protein